MMNLCPIAYWKKLHPEVLAFPTLTYLQFDTLIQKVCGDLTKIKHPILCFAPQKNPLDIALFFAAWRLGKAVYPICPHLPSRAIQMRIEKTKSVWIDPKKLSLAQSLEIEEINPELLATLIETSSANKIACHPLQSHLLSARNVCKALGITQESIYSLNLPLFHVAGIATFLRTFLAGGQLTFPEKETSATHISLVPTQLFRMLENSPSFPNIQCLLMGGAPFSQTLYQKALEKNLPLYLSYGMTETASMAILKSPNRNTQILPHIEFALAEDGEILLRGKSLFSHYWEGERRKKENWFATGDLGKIHVDGEIEIIGRKDRQFISGGENIQPEEIEKALLQFDSIIEAHISPEPDPEFGMRPKAKIYANTPIAPDTIREKLEEMFPRYKIPKEIDIQVVAFESKLTKLAQN